MANRLQLAGVSFVWVVGLATVLIPGLQACLGNLNGATYSLLPLAASWLVLWLASRGQPLAEPCYEPSEQHLVMAA